MAQVKALVGHPGPAVLAGDFNSPPGSAPYPRWPDIGRMGPEPPERRPHHGGSPAPGESLGPDRFHLASPRRGARGLSARILEEPVASDYLPVVVEVGWGRRDNQ